MSTNTDAAAVVPGREAASQRNGTGPRGRGAARAALMVVGAVLLYALPTILGGSSAIYTTFQLIAIYSLLAYGFDLVQAYVGETSLGHLFFWGIGAYSVGLLVRADLMSPILTLVVAVVTVLVAAVVVGLITLRTTHFVFALVTYAVTVVAMTVVSNVPWLGGSNGLVGIPFLELELGDTVLSAREPAAFWTVCFICLMATILFVSYFKSSRLGVKAMLGQANTELAAIATVDVKRTRAIVFVLSSVPSAVGGWLYAYQRGYVGPDLLDMHFLILMLAGAILVSSRLVVWGPVAGIALLVAQQEYLSLGGNGNAAVLGCFLVAVLLFKPARILRRGVRLHGP